MYHQCFFLRNCTLFIYMYVCIVDICSRILQAGIFVGPYTDSKTSLCTQGVHDVLVVGAENATTFTGIAHQFHIPADECSMSRLLVDEPCPVGQQKVRTSTATMDWKCVQFDADCPLSRRRTVGTAGNYTSVYCAGIRIYTFCSSIARSAVVFTELHTFIFVLTCVFPFIVFLFSLQHQQFINCKPAFLFWS